ncbi:MAG: hypothetical protein JNN24_03525 [Hyphomicrobium zavarzinii]|uniref:hypothetical protein n=1 Tax=Hyphomicrobium zavarzinii TaxID=48292 RepID=UPI001A62F2DF|nr:hypothetical protein [Hyphomicrobium zavarzinii]MBL8844821.1 hypothetical protein [Hyphomicrobium zavarzinii]
MPGQNDLGPFGAGVNATTEEPADYGDSGSGDYTWFQDCSSPTADDGTRFTARWANRLLKYIRRAADGMDVPRNEGDMDRLLKAIQKAIRPAANIGGDGAGVGVYKETDTGTLTHMLRRLKGLNGIGVAISEDGNVINIDGSGIVISGLAPIYPEVETVDGKLSVSIGSGQVIVGNTQTFIHRGTRRITCADYSAPNRTFNTSANKTYHLRWKWNAGSPAFSLNDLANGTYNPGALPEGDYSFDSTYDDMLIAKVETNGSNGITVTTLVNRHQHYLEATHLWDNGGSAGSTWQDDTPPELWTAGVDVSLNFARRIQAGIVGLTDCTITGGTEYAAVAIGKTRYRLHLAHTTSGNPQGRFLRYFARM